MEWLGSPEALCLLMFLFTCASLLAGFPVAFTLAGASFLFALLASAFGVFDFSFLSAFPQRIFSVMTNEVLVAVPLFILMGVTLERSKVAEELLDNMGRLFGRMPGGLGYSVCVVGALMAASTGIAGATVVTMGLISLPVMLRRGYDPAISCGTIAASGTLGQIIPPSIILVLLGDQLAVAFQEAQYKLGNFAPDTVSVNELFAGALLPGLLLVGLYIVYLAVRAAMNPQVSPPMPAGELPEDQGAFRMRLLGSLIAPVLLIVAVLGSILGGIASPTEAAGVGAIGALMLSGHRLDEARGGWILAGGGCLAGLLVLTAFFDLRAQRDDLTTADWIPIIAAAVLACGLAVGVGVAAVRTLATRGEDGSPILSGVVRTAMGITSMVFVILIGASMFSLVFRGLGGDVIIEEFLKSLPGGTAAAILLVMAVMFLLGFFLDFLEIVFIVVPIVAPILLQLEIAPGETLSPVWLGIMMAINLQTSFLTPPFGFALFYIRGVAPDSVSTHQIYRGIIPFVAVQLALLAVLWFFPGLATWLPDQLYE